MEFHLGFPYGWEFKLKWAWECSGNGNTTVWDWVEDPRKCLGIVE